MQEKDNTTQILLFAILIICALGFGIFLATLNTPQNTSANAVTNTVAIPATQNGNTDIPVAPVKKVQPVAVSNNYAYQKDCSAQARRVFQDDKSNPNNQGEGISYLSHYSASKQMCLYEELETNTSGEHVMFTDSVTDAYSNKTVIFCTAFTDGVTPNFCLTGTGSRPDYDTGKAMIKSLMSS